MRSPTALLSRKALPQTVKWVGNQEGSFEDFLGLITAHIGQQPHLVYIVIPEFIALWLQFGVVDKVLGLARRMNLHMSLAYITTEQFIFDITWLYNTLKQALENGRGLGITLKYAKLQDGIEVYHKISNRFHYGGHLQTYISVMMIY